MKISYKTHPVLEMLKDNEPNYLAINPGRYIKSKQIEEEALQELVRKVFQRERNHFLNQIDIITEPFYWAIAENSKKFFTDEILKQMGEISGTFMLKDVVVCYHMNYFTKHYTWIEFRNKENLYFAIDAPDNEMNQFMYFENSVLMNEFGKMEYAKRIGCFLAWGIATGLNALKKYAQIETKVVGANKRVKDFNCKYVNDTDSDITILDSTWFTTLVKSEGFKVRGHFRLQPYGIGMQEKKLIWIKDFEKSGYTREAKKPLNDEELPTT